MHHLLTQDHDPDQQPWEVIQRLCEKGVDSKRNDWHLIPLPGFSDYSLELRNLIRDCLIIRPERRPSAQQLMDRADSGLEDSLTKFRKSKHREPVWNVGGEA